MRISTLLRHTQSAERISNPDMLGHLAAAGLSVHGGTLSNWRNGGQPTAANAAIVRTVCASLHTCERCAGDPDELRPLPPKPAKRQRFGVPRSDPRYHTRFDALKRLRKHSETSLRYQADAEAVAAESLAQGVGKATVRQVRERWRVSLT